MNPNITKDGWTTFEELPLGAKFEFRYEQFKTNTKVGHTIYADPWGSLCPFPAVKAPEAVRRLT